MARPNRRERPNKLRHTPERLRAEVRRSRAVELALQGYTQWQIAKLLEREGTKVSRVTITRDLRIARSEMLDDRKEECAADRARILRILEGDLLKLDDFETRALAAIEKSRRERVSDSSVSQAGHSAAGDDGRLRFEAQQGGRARSRARVRRLLRSGGSPAWGRVYVAILATRVRHLKLYADVSGSSAPRNVPRRLDELRRLLAEIASVDPGALPE